MIPTACIEVQTFPEDRPSIPAWFAEVVIMTQHLATKGLLEAFAHQVRLVRGRFGTYEPIDFLALLMGYAISAERSLADFFERLAPFEAAFMALFGRRCLPHRSSLSRLSSRCRSSLREKPCARSSRSTVSRMGGHRKALAVCGTERVGAPSFLMSMPRARRHGNEPCLVLLNCLPLDAASMPNVAPGYTGRKRGEVVRTRTTALQMHTRQWVGTYAGRGNGDYRDELASALQAITAYLKYFALPPEVARVASRRAIWRRSGDCSAHTGRCVLGDAGARLSALGASSNPGCVGSSIDSEGNRDEHR
jgi:hypothetical protein